MQEEILAKYDYSFPEDLIAQKPAKPRDNAKLLVFNKGSGKIDFDTFKNIAKYLPRGSVLVFNQTKVIPARLALTKETGGKVRILFISKEKGAIRVLSDRKLIQNSKVSINAKIDFQVLRQEGKFYFLKPAFPLADLDKIFDRFGSAPIPPYIKNSPLDRMELKEQYQTIFAKIKGSVAAPTASLHFTARLLDKLKKSGIQVEFVTLHVGLGTFAPVTEENLKEEKLHHEYYEIDRETAVRLNTAKKNGKKIIAVGTTVVRTLESATEYGTLKKLSGETDLFIQEGYKFKFTDGIITNFHVPKSSLLMLISAFLGRDKVLALYQEAIKKKFRLFSFGDGMLIK